MLTVSIMERELLTCKVVARLKAFGFTAKFNIKSILTVMGTGSQILSLKKRKMKDSGAMAYPKLVNEKYLENLDIYFFT